MYEQKITLYFQSVISSVVSAISGCTRENGGCQHTCQDTPNGQIYCSCRTGYELNQSDMRSCKGKVPVISLCSIG